MTLRQKLAKTFPFLRLWHSALMRVRYRMRMRLDGNRYAAEKEACLLPHVLQRYQSTLINPNTGYPMEYQRNKEMCIRDRFHTGPQGADARRIGGPAFQPDVYKRQLYYCTRRLIQ